MDLRLSPSPIEDVETGGGSSNRDRAEEANDVAHLSKSADGVEVAGCLVWGFQIAEEDCCCTRETLEGVGNAWGTHCALVH